MRALSNWMWSALVIVCFGIPVFGQNPPGSITGPILGFVQDPAGSAIQPILGVLGASVLGPPLALGADIRNVVISPNQDYAVAVRDENAEVVVIRLGLESAAMNSLDGENAALWVVSSSGFRWLVTADRPSAQSFLPHRHDAVVADDAAQEVS